MLKLSLNKSWINLLVDGIIEDRIGRQFGMGGWDTALEAKPHPLKYLLH